MKLLTSEVKNLLDKLYNLRGEDSVILTKMNKEREDAIKTQERTKKEKEALLIEIDKLTKDESTLADEGNKLMQVLSSIDRNDFANVLTRLNIDFDPESINNKVSKLLPQTIDKVVTENKKASKKLENIETEMNNAVTKVEELGIRKDEALSNQTKLNEYFEMALSGNINITRDEITNLLEKFDFSENEQREAAKLLMFPEDALYEYDTNLKNGEKMTGKTITEVIQEAKKESNNINLEPVKESAKSEPELTNIFEKVIEENVIPTEVMNSNESNDDNLSEKDKLEKLLSEVGLNSQDFSAKLYAKLLENYDAELLKSNVLVLNEKGIDLKIVRENVELLYDSELKEKLEKLLNIGKEAHDICLMPSVLVKYDLKGLNNTINVLQISGLDPSKVPLMAY